MFNVELYRNKLSTEIFGKNIVVLDSVTSTNDAIVEFQEHNGFVLLANVQTKGRGRMGRIWYSNSDDNLYFSFIINNIDVQLLPMVGLFVAFSLYDILRVFGPFKIKWPNDIVLSKKKLAGILTESKIINNKLLYAVVGVGINVNAKDFPPEIKDIATSIYLACNKEVSREELLANFFNSFEYYLLTYKKSNIKIDVREKWKEASEYINKLVKITVDGKTEYFVERGISSDGALCVEDMSGNIKKIYYGDILNVDGS
jgi:BirA family biotin operon repressor/biotin-[acetyl-CoA-carboxylase] ligase